MKLLYCQVCGDIVAPLPRARLPRWCRCQTHAVWWENPQTGILRLYEKNATYTVPSGDVDPKVRVWARKRSDHRAYVLGIHNGFLTARTAHSAETVQLILEATPQTYIFKTTGSLIIRIRPGESNDTDWSELLPEDEAVFNG